MTNIKTLVRVGDVAKVISGYAFSSKDFIESGVPIVKIANVRVGYVDMADTQCVAPAFLRLDPKYHVKRGDILISLTGSHLNQPNSVVGRVALFRHSIPHCLLNQRAGKLLIRNPDLCDARFLFYALSAPEKLHAIATMAHGAANQANVSPTQVESVQVFMPDIRTQRTIGAVLSAYDDLIENNTRRITILEHMAQMLYPEWFVNFRFPGHENVRMVESELGPIPEGWMPKRLGDLCHETRRGVDPSEIDPTTPYIGLEHLPRKSIALGEWGRAGDVGSTKLRFKRGEILFGKIRPYFHKVGVAPVDGVASSDAIVIVPNDPAYFGLVLCCVSSEDFVRHATQTSQGTKMPRANWDVLTKYPVSLPDATLLEHFNGLIHPTVEMLQNLVFRNRNLHTTRDLLLPKLISGKISVEAASELVEQPA